MIHVNFHFRSKTTTLDDFEVLSTIGTGSYGTCKKIERKKDGKVRISVLFAQI